MFTPVSAAPPVPVTLSFLDLEPISFEVRYVSEPVDHAVTMRVFDVLVDGHMFSNLVGRQLEKQVEAFAEKDLEKRLPYKFEMTTGSSTFSECWISEVNYDDMDHSLSSTLMTLKIRFDSEHIILPKTLVVDPMELARRIPISPPRRKLPPEPGRTPRETSIPDDET